MNKRFIAGGALVSAVFLCASAGSADTGKGEKINGQKEFEQHCAVCHPKGGNVVTPQKTLSRKTLEANGVKGAKDIIAKMRNPGPGMTKFDEKTIPNKEAKAIAEYILKTFK
ncbi:MAG TPA: c-type cytochrome [Desulfuromonadaceae bacterium]